MLQKSSTALIREAIKSVQAALQPTFIPFSCHVKPARSVATCFTNSCCPEQVEPFDHVSGKKNKLLFLHRFWDFCVFLGRWSRQSVSQSSTFSTRTGRFLLTWTGEDSRLRHPNRDSCSDCSAEMWATSLTSRTSPLFYLPAYINTHELWASTKYTKLCSVS